MAPLSMFSLPLPQNGPPPGYGWEEYDISASSTTTAFNDSIDQRDTFLGQRRCIICGIDCALQHCHIIRDLDLQSWSNLKARRWIPSQAKAYSQHEPRDGMLMCANHHASFKNYSFFIRFLPDVRKFVFVNYSGHIGLQQFHGKAIALDIKDRHAPFPSLFILHEMRVRGFNPFGSLHPAIPNDIPWQDWILLDSLVDHTSHTFKRDGPPDCGGHGFPAQMQPQFTQPLFQPTMTSSGGGMSSGECGRQQLELNADVIADILAASHAMPSWRACQMEGTSWTGTAEENIEKYAAFKEDHS